MMNTVTSPSPSEVRSSRHGPAALDLVVLGNPASRRLSFLNAALARRQMRPARVVSYIDYLSGRIRIADALRERGVLRIESPGQDFAVERAILAEGVDLAPAGREARLDRGALERLSFERGRILSPRQWYQGFVQVLSRIEKEIAAVPVPTVMNDPASIALLFDKVRCHERLRGRGISCPRSLPQVDSYDALRSHMRDAGVGRVFVKLLCGSSASGIVALETNGQRTQASTTVEAVGFGHELRLYNSRRIRRIIDERMIARLVNVLAAEGVHVEQWVPKAGLGGYTFDLRVVVIAGQPEHAVVRLSRGPFTNLHLKNCRGELRALRDRMDGRAWDALLDTCRQVGASFPKCHYLGVDVAVLPGYRRHVVLEVNAFGDLLPGVVDSSGRDTYTAEIDAQLSMPTGSVR